jgi:hypothetical protein
MYSPLEAASLAIEKVGLPEKTPSSGALCAAGSFFLGFIVVRLVLIAVFGFVAVPRL